MFFVKLYDIIFILRYCVSQWFLNLKRYDQLIDQQIDAWIKIYLLNYFIIKKQFNKLIQY